MPYPMKRLPLTLAYNVRDLGGYPALLGKTTRWHTLYRADQLGMLGSEDWQLLYAYNVRTVIDLRGDDETQRLPDRVPKGITYLHCPLQYPAKEGKNAAAPSEFVMSLSDTYQSKLRDEPELLTKALQAVVDHLGNGAVLFHCTAGKDRTGIVAASLLKLLGVADEDIVADYEVSHTHNTHGVNKTLFELVDLSTLAASYGVDTENMRRKLLSLMGSEPDNMRAFLTLIAGMDFSSYLIEHGLDHRAVKTLRAAALV